MAFLPSYRISSFWVTTMELGMCLEKGLGPTYGFSILSSGLPSSFLRCNLWMTPKFALTFFVHWTTFLSLWLQWQFNFIRDVYFNWVVKVLPMKLTLKQRHNGVKYNSLIQLLLWFSLWLALANSSCDSFFHNGASRYHRIRMGWLQYI